MDRMKVPLSANPAEALRDGEYAVIVDALHERMKDRQVSSPIALCRMSDLVASLLDEAVKSGKDVSAIDILAQQSRRTITQTQDIVGRSGLAHNGSVDRRRALAEEIMMFVPDNVD